MYCFATEGPSLSSNAVLKVINKYLAWGGANCILLSSQDCTMVAGGCT